MSTAVEPAAEPRSAKAPGLLGILGDLYVAPRQAFSRLLPRPRWWAALFGMIALNVAFTAIWTQKADPVEFMREQIESSPRADRMPAEQKEQVIEQQARMFPVFAWLGPLFLPLMMVSVAAVYLFVFRFVMGGEVGFASSLAIVAWSFLAVSLVTMPLLLTTIALKDDWNADPRGVLQANPSLLLDKADTAPFLYSLAESLDLFSFWTLALLAAGYAVAHGKPNSWALPGCSARGRSTCSAKRRWRRFSEPACLAAAAPDKMIFSLCAPSSAG